MTIYPSPENLEHHAVVTHDQWLIARAELLKREKEFTLLRDQISARRRALPWVRVEKNYVFQAPDGQKTLVDLFEGRSQLLVKHFMFAPGWKAGCVGCSFGVDHIEGALVHLGHHDVTCVAVSRATLAEIEAFKQRMGWRLPWVSSFGSDFNYDYQVSFTKEEIAEGKACYNYKMQEVENEEKSGISVFYKNAASDVFHTYSTYGRGDEELVTAYMCLDLTPKGRNENGPYFALGDWVRHHDRYGDDNFDFTEPYQQAEVCGCGSGESHPQ
jgi:predicted dithiol-disulfide oxidoreductase (DUF899 family)